MSPEVDRPNETTILITVALATMLAPLNSTMIGVALPQIMREFTTDLSAGSWLVIAYLITMASLQPVGGKLGDRLGRRPLIIGGLIYFGIASLGAAFASSLTELLVFRVQQGIAGAIALPNGMALMREIVPAERRASRIGLLGSAIVLAAAAGPPLGGVLIRVAGWRAVFYANLLIILPALILALRALPGIVGERRRQPFDLVGALQLLALLCGGAVLLTGSLQTWPAMGKWGAGALLGALAVHFLRREARHDDPVFQPRFFRRATFAAGNAGVGLSNLAMYTTFLAIPLLLADLPPKSAEATYRPPALELLTTAHDVFHLPQPAPVLWRDPDPRTDPGEVDAVLSVGEVAILASAGGLGKSCLTPGPGRRDGDRGGGRPGVRERLRPASKGRRRRPGVVRRQPGPDRQPPALVHGDRPGAVCGARHAARHGVVSADTRIWRSRHA